MMKNAKKYITKQEAIEHFQNEYLPDLVRKYGLNDRPAIREAWNNFTNSLCLDRAISMAQYDSWMMPKSFTLFTINENMTSELIQVYTE